MMTSLCPDAPGVTPATVTAVKAQGTLTTTGGKRLKMLLSLILFALAGRGLMHHARHHHREHKHGRWDNATEADEVPTTVVPCSVDLPELLEKAGVTGIDAMMINHEHGCCGDDICTLGEDSSTCDVDCPNGMKGYLVWREQDDHHGNHHDERHENRSEEHDEAMDDTENSDYGVLLNEAGSEEIDTDAGRTHRGRRGDGRSRGHSHSATHKLITSAMMGILGLALLLSIRHSWMDILRDFYIFLCPSCGHSSPKQSDAIPPIGMQSHKPHVNAIAVGPTSSGKDQAEVFSTV